MANDNKGNEENPILGTGPENLKEHFIRTNNEGFLAYKKRTGKLSIKHIVKYSILQRFLEFPQPFYCVIYLR